MMAPLEFVDSAVDLKAMVDLTGHTGEYVIRLINETSPCFRKALGNRKIVKVRNWGVLRDLGFEERFTWLKIHQRRTSSNQNLKGLAKEAQKLELLYLIEAFLELSVFPLIETFLEFDRRPFGIKPASLIEVHPLTKAPSAVCTPSFLWPSF
jgi:hypothetical protein